MDEYDKFVLQPKTILKINRDKEFDEVVKKYPLDKYKVEIISCESINSRTERIMFGIEKIKDKNGDTLKIRL